MFTNSRHDRWFGFQLLLTVCLLLAIASYATADPKKGTCLKMGPKLRPIAHWRFGESKGDAANDAVGSHHGEYECGVQLGLKGALTYDPNTAAGFNGKAAHVAVPHHKDFELASGTLSLWFNASEVKRRQGIFSKDANGFGNGGHFTIWLESGVVSVRLQSAKADNMVRAKGIKECTWYHLAVTFGSGGLKLYLNGQLASSNDYQGGFAAGPKTPGNREPIAIGANTFTSKPGSLHPLCDFFHGRIDEVLIFDRALEGQGIERLRQKIKSDRRFS